MSRVIILDTGPLGLVTNPMLSLRQRMWGTYQDLLQPNCGRALLQVDRHLTLRWWGRDRSYW